MRFLIAAALLFCATAFAQIPETDSRNTNTPSTDTHFTAKTYTSLQEWEQRRAFLKKQILSAAGLLPMLPKNDLHPQVFGKVEYRDYTTEKVLIETLPGYYLGGNLYRPRKPAPAGGYPAIISPHGHWPYGRLENTAIASIPARGITLARQGYVVFTYDMVGYNDSLQTPHDFGDKPVEQLWAFGPLGLQLWNSIRAIDFVASLSDVNPQRIGATGASGGASQTILVQAVDDRIQYSAPANMVSFIMQGGSLCENAPNLRLDTNNVEFASIMAPRPMIMTAASGDWTRNLATEEYPAIRAVYDLYGKGADVEYWFQQAPHNYNQPNREAVYAFFGKHVLGIGDAAKLKEHSFSAPPLPTMLALQNRTLPDNALTFAQIFDEWKRLAEAQSGDERERLQLALAAEWPAKVLSKLDGENVVLSRAGRGDRVPGIYVKGLKDAVLIVSPDGADAARRTPEFAAAVRQGRTVLAIDAFQTGSAAAPRNRGVRNFLTFNKSDDANRVQDILTALAWLHAERPALLGLGKASVWCLFAAAVSPRPVELRADTSWFHGTDQEFADDFFVPGIQRAGGLKAALRLARP